MLGLEELSGHQRKAQTNRIQLAKLKNTVLKIIHKFLQIECVKFEFRECPLAAASIATIRDFRGFGSAFPN
jgi:septum formation topological specificity factor MinE